MDTVQKALREVPGVSILIYEQMCATEKRRRRKRGTLDDPKRFAVINELVCEGCGDCSVESNCLSVEPFETEFGTKRKINLSNCNKDFSCLNGFCPSFVTVEGAERKKQTGNLSLANLQASVSALPEPEFAQLNRPYNLLVTGVGGTGVVTVGALITMAAHLEGRGATVLDFTGFAQKFGSVISYIRLADEPAHINQVRIDDRSADAVIGCDVVVSSSPKASAAYRVGTHVALNTALMPTGDLILNRDADLRVDHANEAAERLLGDAVFANVMMMGFSWQLGLVPVSLHALDRAIELNAVAVEKNRTAFQIGRVLAGGKESMESLIPAEVKADDSLTALVNHRANFLVDYQNKRWSDRYRRQIDHLMTKESALGSEQIFQFSITLHHHC